MTFNLRDAADPGLAGRYDVVTIFEALHDMSHPVDVLRAMRGLLVDGGALLIADERTAERFSLTPATSSACCTRSASRTACPSGMTGERPGRYRHGDARGHRASATRATLASASCEVLPIENDFYRFYLLRV